MDTIRFGPDREPKRWRHGIFARPQIHSRVAWVAVMLMTAALAAAIAVAAHYRDEALHRSTSPLPPHGALAGQVTVFVAQSPLPPLGALTGQVTVFVAQYSAGRPPMTCSASRWARDLTGYGRSLPGGGAPGWLPQGGSAPALAGRG